MNFTSGGRTSDSPLHHHFPSNYTVNSVYQLLHPRPSSNVSISNLRPSPEMATAMLSIPVIATTLSRSRSQQTSPKSSRQP